MIDTSSTTFCAVETKVVAATATRAMRIRVASLTARPIVRHYNYDHGVRDIKDAHMLAATEFLKEMRWDDDACVWRVGATAWDYVLVREDQS